MVVSLIICIIANFVCCYYTAKINEGEKDLKKRKDISNILFVASIILSIIAAILLINIIDSNSKGVGVANYNYYINGKKVSSSSYAATQNFFIGFMFFILLFGAGMSISAHIVNKKNKPKVDKNDKKPSIIALIFSVLSIIFGIALIFSGISALTNSLKTNSNVSPIIALFLSVVFLGLGIWGIITFIKRTRRKKEKDNNN